MKNIKVFTFNKLKGYTLLELLVVIGLITILMSFAVASYSTAQKKARDSKRRSDLKTIQNGLEQWYSICSYTYPAFWWGNITLDQVKIDSALVTGDACMECNIPEGTWPGQTLVPLMLDPLGGNYQCVPDEYHKCNSTSTYRICPPDLGGGKFLETENCGTGAGMTLDCCVTEMQ